MKLLLVFLLGTVILGFITEKLDARTYALLFAGVALTTGTYFFFDRFLV